MREGGEGKEGVWRGQVAVEEGGLVQSCMCVSMLLLFLGGAPPPPHHHILRLLLHLRLHRVGSYHSAQCQSSSMSRWALVWA